MTFELEHHNYFAAHACIITLAEIQIGKKLISFFNSAAPSEMSYMFNLNTFGAYLWDSGPILQNLESYQSFGTGI